MTPPIGAGPGRVVWTVSSPWPNSTRVDWSHSTSAAGRFVHTAVWASSDTHGACAVITAPGSVTVTLRASPAYATSTRFASLAPAT
jgi:hypothetical protein